MTNKNNELYNLMIKAIEEKRPAEIDSVCLPIWNQPFFYKIDKAKALTISLSPTDTGAKKNYKDALKKFIENQLSSSEIYDILYNFKKEDDWRRPYDIILNNLGLNDDEITHMDFSFFPYKDDKYLRQYSKIDNTHTYLLEVIRLLSNQLQYIFVDGKKNEDFVKKHLVNSFYLINESEHQVNKGVRKFKLLIYKHQTMNLHLIFYGHFLGRSGYPSNYQIAKISEHIKKVLLNKNNQTNIVKYKTTDAPMKVIQTSKYKEKPLEEKIKNPNREIYNRLFKLIETNLNKSETIITSKQAKDRHWAVYKNERVATSVDILKSKNIIRVNLYMEDSFATFDKLHHFKDQINEEFGINLNWDRTTSNGKKSSRIQTYILGFDSSDYDTYEEFARKTSNLILKFSNIFYKHFIKLGIHYKDYNIL